MVQNEKNLMQNENFFWKFSQHLVDWSRGMVMQIGGLGDNYAHWVNRPVDRPLRLFDSTALEMLTKTPWWLVPCFWIPIIGFIAMFGINHAHAMAYSNVSYVSVYIPFHLFHNLI